MMKKNILLMFAAISIISSISAEKSIKKSVYLCDVLDYRNRNDKLPHDLDQAIIFTLTVGERPVEITTFKDASEDTFKRLNRLGFIQCYDFTNNVPVIVSTTTLSKNVMVCEKINKFYEEYLVANKFHKEYPEISENVIKNMNN